jgi:hypothetical protein
MTKINPGPIIQWPIITKTFTVIALIFGIANAAHAAGKLITPALRIATPSALASCTVVNAATKPATVQITIFDTVGDVEKTETIDVPPGDVTSTGGTVTSGFYYCVIEVIDGKKKSIRGSLTFIDFTADFFLGTVEAH